MFPFIAGIITLLGVAFYCWWIDDELPETIIKPEALHQQPRRQLQEQGRILIANWPIRRDVM